MREVGVEEYLRYVEARGEVVVEGRSIQLKPIRVSRLAPGPGEMTDTSTSVWSFPRRGAWATHRGDYRGNWPPQLVRALITMYTSPGDTVLDPMVGGGTTCVEAKLLGRNCIGVDISYDAVMLAMHRVYWLERHLEGLDAEAVGGVRLDDIRSSRVAIYHGDARNLLRVGDGSVDLVAMHPPYFNIIRYTRRKGRGGVEGDLSSTSSLEDYLRMLGEAAGESFRVLKPGGHIGVLLGDTRVRRHYVPITHYGLDVFLGAGFLLREEVVKIQHRMKGTRERWAGRNRGFLLIYHEKLYVMRKPAGEDEYEKYRYSARITRSPHL